MKHSSNFKIILFVSFFIFFASAFIGISSYAVSNAVSDSRIEMKEVTVREDRKALKQELREKKKALKQEKKDCIKGCEKDKDCRKQCKKDFKEKMKALKEEYRAKFKELKGKK